MASRAVVVAALLALLAPQVRSAPVPAPATMSTVPEPIPGLADRAASHAMATAAAEVWRLVKQREDVGNERFTTAFVAFKVDCSRQWAVAAAASARTDEKASTALDDHLQRMRVTETRMRRLCGGLDSPFRDMLLAISRYAVAEAEDLAGQPPAGGRDAFFPGTAEQVWGQSVKAEKASGGPPTVDLVVWMLEWSRRWAEAEERAAAGPRPAAAESSFRRHDQRMRKVRDEVNGRWKDLPDDITAALDYAVTHAAWCAARADATNGRADARTRARYTRDAAERLYDSLVHGHDSGRDRMTPDATAILCAVSNTWADVGADEAWDAVGVRAARDAHATRMKELERVLIDRFLSGTDSSAVSAAMMRYYVAEADWKADQSRNPK